MKSDLNSYLSPIRAAFRTLLLSIITTPLFGSPTAEIQVDQTGYLPEEAKFAMVTGSSAAGSFSVVSDPGGVTLLSGNLGPPLADAASGMTVRTVDFSPVTTAGGYRLEVAGVGQSYGFRIGPSVYTGAYRMAMRFFTGQRCGTSVDLGGGYQHGVCHAPGSYSGQSDATLHGSTGLAGFKRSTKGWHDAGDYGKYVVNSGISTGELLWTYEWFSDRIGKLDLKVPESGNGTPDILNECRWNLEWMLTMQDKDGGVWHKVSSSRFPSGPKKSVMPEFDDAGPRYIIGTGSGAPYKCTGATADFAAVMAVAGRLYRPFDPAFADTCLQAAVRAWGWLGTKGHDDVRYVQPQGISTGGYGDPDLRDEMLWASAELFRTTGEPFYNGYFLRHYACYQPLVTASEYPQDWQHVKNLAYWTYFFSGRSTADAKARAAVKEQTLAAADAVVRRQSREGYRVSLGPGDYKWGSNGGVGNYGVLLLAANAMRPKADYRQAALDDLHYLLGRNAEKMSFVTQVGSVYPMRPHHRPSWSDGLSKPWPGMLVGGPNRGGGDRKTPTGLPPALCYVDDSDAYASNEVAINWNAPLVFLLASQLPIGGCQSR